VKNARLFFTVGHFDIKEQIKSFYALKFSKNLYLTSAQATPAPPIGWLWAGIILKILSKNFLLLP